MLANDIQVTVGKYEESGRPDVDPESIQTVEHPPGFAELAGYLASDCERSIFKRFRWLTARNLLMMQAEISSLEERIRCWDQEDRTTIETQGPSASYQLYTTLTSWDALVESAKTNKRDAEKMEIFTTLRNLLPAYRKYSRISNVRPI